ncbi:MAG: hypothetical protein ACQESF_02985 [Nanobdellota archaeon]
MLKKKRGQAALEFLMTYGWAFLVIMIMIGALAYFGVLSPQKFLPDRCKFGTPILCKGEQYVIKQAGDDASGDNPTVMARLINNFGRNVHIRNFEISTDYSGVCTSGNYGICLDKDGSGDCNGDDMLTAGGAGNEVVWEAGKAYSWIVECTNGATGLTVGDKVKFSISAEWYPTSSSATYAKPVEGEIYATVSK